LKKIRHPNIIEYYTSFLKVINLNEERNFIYSDGICRRGWFVEFNKKIEREEIENRGEWFVAVYVADVKCSGLFAQEEHNPPWHKGSKRVDNEEPPDKSKFSEYKIADLGVSKIQDKLGPLYQTKVGK